MLSISTKTGDTGQTSLADGTRISKADPMIEAIGTLDEVNAWLGIVVRQLEHDFPDDYAVLVSVQADCFRIGAELAKFPQKTLKKKTLTLLESRSEFLQKEMAQTWMKNFVLPGGNALAAQLDVTRTVVRRFERRLVAADQIGKIRPLLFQITNRLSDYLFVLRTFVNKKYSVKEKIFTR